MKISTKINITQLEEFDLTIKRIPPIKEKTLLNVNYRTDYLVEKTTQGGHAISSVVVDIEWAGPDNKTWADINDLINSRVYSSNTPELYNKDTLQRLAMYFMRTSGRKNWADLVGFVEDNCDNEDVINKTRNTTYDLLMTGIDYEYGNGICLSRDKKNKILADIRKRIYENYNANIYGGNSPLGNIGDDIQGKGTVHRMEMGYVTIKDHKTGAYVQGKTEEEYALYNTVAYSGYIDEYSVKYSTTRLTDFVVVG